MSALNTSVVEMVKSIKKGEITSEELVKNYIKEIKKKEKDVQAWEFFDEELAITQAKKTRFAPSIRKSWRPSRYSSWY